MKHQAERRAAVVLAERRGVVGLVIINRPEARNAINRDVALAIADALDAWEADDEVRAVVLTGAGELAFCAGADLKASPRQRPIAEGSGGFAGITARQLGKPVIAAVNGVAFGGGVEICLTCDIVVAEDHARFGLPEVRRGIVAAAGGLERLPRRIPPAIAMEMILTGAPIDARRALELGLINRVVPRGEAVSAATEIADAIALGAPLAVRYSAAVARASIAAGERDGIDSLAELHHQIFAGHDRREGALAFAEKRPARWTGT